MKRFLLLGFVLFGLSTHAQAFDCATVKEDNPAFQRGSNMVVELSQRCELALEPRQAFDARDIANVFIHLIRQSDQLLMVSEKDESDDTFEINFKAVRTGSGGNRAGSISTNEKLKSTPSRVSYESVSYSINAKGLAALARGVKIEANVYRQCAGSGECMIVLETHVSGEIERPKFTPFQIFKATVLPIMLNEFSTTSSVFQQYIEITVRSKVVGMN